jgi:hypothetical protein
MLEGRGKTAACICTNEVRGIDLSVEAAVIERRGSKTKTSLRCCWPKGEVLAVVCLHRSAKVPTVGEGGGVACMYVQYLR